MKLNIVVEYASLHSTSHVVILFVILHVKQFLE